jgi:membrane protease YdiL (CAAX protease family)
VAFVVWRQQEQGASIRKGGEELSLLLQGRMLVGLDQAGAHAMVVKELPRLEVGPYPQRLLVAILVGTLAGPEAVGPYLKRLEELRAEQEYQPTEAEDRLRQAIEHVYVNRQLGEELAGEDRTVLAERGWFGDLALLAVDGEPATGGPRRAASRSFVAILAATALGLLTAVAGFILIVIFLILWTQGQWRWAVEPRRGSGLYAETFAVWFILFLLLGLLARWLPYLQSTFASGALTLLSVLLALYWPVLRGRDWWTVRAELGLYPGRSVGREILAGVATYIAALPVLLGATVVVAGLTSWYTRWLTGGAPPAPFAPSNNPSHPAAGMVLGDLWTLLALYWAAAVTAPLAEEIAFRGILQRHLRGFLGRLTSAVAVGLVFAIIHPQGVLAVPALLTLAVVFSLAREWRGSLIAPMTAHALNNAAVVTVLLVATR